MIIQCGLAELRPGYEWRVAVGQNGLRSLHVSSECMSRFFRWVDAYRVCKAAAEAFGFEFEQYGYTVTNWYSVPNAATCQSWIASRRWL
jgi:hypothetical protein